MKKFNYLFVSIVAISLIPCNAKVNDNLFGGTGDSSIAVADSQDNNSEEPAEIEPQYIEFNSSNYHNEKTVDNDGIECRYEFNIDWPEQGNPEVLRNIKTWISKSVLNKQKDCATAKDLANAVMSISKDWGYISEKITVKIIKEENSEIVVTTSNEWSAGYSTHSPWGNTDQTAKFNSLTGDLLSQSVVKEGDDIYKEVQVVVKEEELICENPDKVAEFPGGQAALMKWLSNNMRYPESAQANDIQGRVIVRFVVEKDGSISNVTVAKSVAPDLDREAKRLVGKMPRWQPGIKNGVPVRTYYSLPYTFKLQI